LIIIILFIKPLFY